MVRKNRGFTLMEVIISIAILFITVGGAVYVLINAQHMMQETRQRLLALNAARSTLEVIKTTGLGNVPSIKTAQYISAGLPNGAVVITTNPADLAGASIATVTVTVNWTGPRNRPKSLTITTMKSRY